MKSEVNKSSQGTSEYYLDNECEGEKIVFV